MSGYEQDLVRTLRIKRLERLANTRAGNPRWRVWFTDGTVAQTRPDAGVAYAIDSTAYAGLLDVTFDRDGYVRAANPRV